jgi:hypothetical protein
MFKYYQILARLTCYVNFTVFIDLHLTEMALPSSSKAVPQGYTALHESTTEILIPSSSLPSNPADNPSQTKQVFLNPVQEYNRDLSVIAIRCWSELRVKEHREKREKGMKKGAERKGPKGNKKRKVQEQEQEPTADDADKVRKWQFPTRGISVPQYNVGRGGDILCADEILDGYFC